MFDKIFLYFVIISLFQFFALFEKLLLMDVFFGLVVVRLGFSEILTHFLPLVSFYTPLTL